MAKRRKKKPVIRRVKKAKPVKKAMPTAGKKMSKNRLGLTLGIFVGALHVIWVATVGLGAGQKSLEYIMPLHFLSNVYSVLPFNWSRAMALVLLAFVGSFVSGWLFAGLWNLLRKVK